MILDILAEIKTICVYSFLIIYETEIELHFAAMKIQLSESIYDELQLGEPKFVITQRGLRNVLVSSTVTCTCFKAVYFAALSRGLH